jgi:hypothetical protein
LGWQITRVAIVAGFLWVPVFLVPLLFCAGMQFYLIDLENFGEKKEWDERFLLFVLVVIGAIIFSLFTVSVIGVALSILVDQAPSLSHILPWALPPALFAITFFFMSRISLFGNPRRNSVVDFITHGLIAAASGWLAQLISVKAGLQYQLFYIPLELVQYGALFISALTGATLGAIQCRISRIVDNR